MTLAIIQGFSKLSKSEKINVIAKQLDKPDLLNSLSRYWFVSDQNLFDEFSENTVTNYVFPLGVAPNFLINGQIVHVPMVTEESSVIAAAASAAKFWLNHGGFQATVLDIQKKGHVYFRYTGDHQRLTDNWQLIRDYLIEGMKPDLETMVNRGGGLIHLDLDRNIKLPDIYYLSVAVDTVDAMGANFINTLLENLSVLLKISIKNVLTDNFDFEIIMAILSNYTPECVVRCCVLAPVHAFDNLFPEWSGHKFAEKMVTAVQIAETDLNRAVTHNKGIMNGVDAVVLATGNDFRAVEADAHAYASKNGTYASLSTCTIQDGIFKLSLDIPMSVGTVGGLTRFHPMAKCSLELLQSPNARQLMMIIASVGLASHFAALRALVTGGIQRGHMKMHLSNILAQLGATDEQKLKATLWFADKLVSFNAVRDFLNVT